MYHLSKVFFPSTQQLTDILMKMGSAAVSQVEKRDELLSKVPSNEGSKQVQWVWGGMLIELEQCVQFL